LGERADFAPLYVSRAYLLEQERQLDPEADLRRAVELDTTNRTTRIHLIRHLQGQERWDDALAESHVGREAFPGDFNLDLLHVQSLIEVGRAQEAVSILNATHVLPSENARTSHLLWEQAHTIVAMDAMENGAYEDARARLRAALEWPEHLGQGRPYYPEERLQRFLLGVTARCLGEDQEPGVAEAAAWLATVAAPVGNDMQSRLAARARSIGDASCRR
jgi:hypothetical protein